MRTAMVLWCLLLGWVGWVRLLDRDDGVVLVEVIPDDRRADERIEWGEERLDRFLVLGSVFSIALGQQTLDESADRGDIHECHACIPGTDTSDEPAVAGVVGERLASSGIEHVLDEVRAAAEDDDDVRRGTPEHAVAARQV